MPLRPSCQCRFEGIVGVVAVVEVVGDYGCILGRAHEELAEAVAGQLIVSVAVVEQFVRVDFAVVAEASSFPFLRASTLNHQC